MTNYDSFCWINKQHDLFFRRRIVATSSSRKSFIQNTLGWCKKGVCLCCSIDVKRTSVYAMLQHRESYTSRSQLKIGNLAMKREWRNSIWAFKEHVMRHKIGPNHFPNDSILWFEIGCASPCNFTHEAKELFVTVHGDDFTITGPMDSLRWLKNRLEQAYEIMEDYLGPYSEWKTEIRC